MIAYREADTDEKRPRRRLTVDYQATPNFQPGLEVNFAVDEVGVRATWVLQKESDSRPQVHMNTSSDRIGSPKGTQQYSFVVSKSLAQKEIAPYAGLTYSEFNDGLVVPWGLSYRFSPEWNLIFMNDGRNSHALATFSAKNWYGQVGLVWMRRLAVTVGWGW